MPGKPPTSGEKSGPVETGLTGLAATALNLLSVHVPASELTLEYSGKGITIM